jgi:hypothetical protein
VPRFAARCASAHDVEHARRRFEPVFGRTDLGRRDGERDFAASFRGQIVAAFPRAIEDVARTIGEERSALEIDGQLAVTQKNVGIVTRLGDAGRRPGTGLRASVVTRFGDRPLREAEVDVREHELRDARAQRREDGTERPGGIQNLPLFDDDVGELGAAAVGLALSDVVPIVVNANTAARGGDRGDHETPSSRWKRGNDEAIGVLGTGAKALRSVDHPSITLCDDRRARVERVQRVPPKPCVTCGLGVERRPLLLFSEETRRRQQKVVEAEDVTNGAVGARQNAHRAHRVGPIASQAAEFDGNRQGEQSTLAQKIALLFGRAALFVAHGRCLRKNVGNRRHRGERVPGVRKQGRWEGFG